LFIKDFRDSPAMCDVVKDEPTQKTYNPSFVDALIDANACPGLEKG
jgi:hypothetical protein